MILKTIRKIVKGVGENGSATSSRGQKQACSNKANFRLNYQVQTFIHWCLNIVWNVTTFDFGINNDRI